MQTALTILGHLVFWLVGLAGLGIIFLGLPGTFLILAAAVVFDWVNDFATLGWPFLGLLLGIALVAELVEFVLGAVTASRFGSSKSGMAGAIVGAFVVGLLAAPLLPPFGMILGAFFGAFAGAVLFEFITTADWKRALRAGYGAFLGSLGGRVFKLAAAAAMLVLLAVKIY